MLSDSEIQIDGITYKILALIGEGTSGAVWTVSNPEGSKYALKIIYDYGRNPVMKMLVDQEITIQQKFQHNDFIIDIYASKEKNRQMNILFELGTCSLRRKIEMGTHIELRQFLDICLDTTKGIMAVHNKDYIHRDIKPENIICVEKTYKITDFGSLQGGTVGEGNIGTPLYLAPEMLFQEGKEYSQKIDVWSLGVTLFETYFRIHPFFYLKECDNHKEIYEQLRKNIKALLPKFTMEKFLSYASNFISKEKVERIRNILLVTPSEIIEQFTHFFQYEEDRPDINYFVMAFESLIEPISDRRPNKVRVKVKIEELPSDLRFYVDTLNIFYDLSFRYGTQRFDKVEFHLELGLWYWNFYNYLGQAYLSYTHYSSLKEYKKDKTILWEEVKSALMDYFLQISTNKELQFYGQLPILKIRLLLCGAMFDINPQLQTLLNMIGEKVQMQIETIQMLTTYLNIFQVSQLKRIEEILTNRYYY